MRDEWNWKKQSKATEILGKQIEGIKDVEETLYQEKSQCTKHYVFDKR